MNVYILYLGYQWAEVKRQKKMMLEQQFYLFFSKVTPRVHGCQDTEFLPSCQQLYLIILVLKVAFFS